MWLSLSDQDDKQRWQEYRDTTKWWRAEEWHENEMEEQSEWENVFISQPHEFETETAKKWKNKQTKKTVESINK